MIGWTWLVIAWGAAGAICAGVMVWTNRRDLARDRFGTLGAAAFIAVGAPVVVAFAVVYPFVMLAKGEIPFTRRNLWGAREGEEDRTWNRDSTLVDLVALRRRHDPRLKNAPHPEKWPMFRVWGMPEAMILDVIELHFLMTGDGQENRLALERLEAWRSEVADAPEPTPLEIREYVKYRLRIEDPQYPLHNEKMFDSVCQRAEEFTKASTRRRAKETWPPSAWMKQSVDLIDLDRHINQFRRIRGGPGGFIPEAKARDVARIKLRIMKGDEVRVFESPPETWEALCGRAGIALVRNGQAIEHFITAMN